MKKLKMLAAVCVLTLAFSANAALAKPAFADDHGKKGQETTLEQQDSSDVQVDVEDTDSEDSVTSATYEDQGHGKKGYKGLFHAIENVKDKPAGAVIANMLLTKYQTNLTPEMKAELEQIVSADEALSAAADMLEQEGSVTDAVYMQQEAVKANVKNMKSYNKLGKLYEKMGKKGVKLYVNGEEPAFDVAPFIKDNKTLVPFRAIAEALKADVKWDPVERSVTVSRDGVTVKLIIGSTTAYVNGQEVTLEVPASIVKGHTVIPVRFISESLSATVKWDGETQSVVIYEE